MGNKVKLVRNDTLPRLVVTLFDVDTGEQINLANALVKMKIREPGADVLKSTLVGELLSSGGAGGESGEVRFTFNAGDLDEAGQYEAEYEVTFADGRIQTVYEVDKLLIRADFPNT